MSVTDALSGVSEDQLRDFITELVKQTTPSFTPPQHIKGVVSAIDEGSSTTPPTITVLVEGDSTTPISGVRIAADYSPYVGDTVLIAAQGSDLLAVMTIATVGSKSVASAGGWIYPSDLNGHTNNANNMGNVGYRRVLQDGCWKVQWRGGVAWNFNNSGLLVTPVAPIYRPSVGLFLITTREIDGGISVQLAFDTDGNVNVFGGNLGVNWLDHTHYNNWDSGTGGSTVPGGYHGDHSHYIYGADMTGRSHNHAADNPNWVSFQGVEYFI